MDVRMDIGPMVVMNMVGMASWGLDVQRVFFSFGTIGLALGGAAIGFCGPFWEEGYACMRGRYVLGWVGYGRLVFDDVVIGLLRWGIGVSHSLGTGFFGNLWWVY